MFVVANGTGKSINANTVATNTAINAPLISFDRIISPLTGDIFMTKQQNLANRLLYLPIDLNEKVLLWLTHKGLKPVSQICAEKRDRKYLKMRLTDPERAKQYKPKEFNFDSPNSKRIRKWLNDAGLKLITNTPPDSDWYVGQNETDVRKVFSSIGKFDYDNQVTTGLLLGFPKESVLAYVKNLDKEWEEAEKEMVGTGEALVKDKFLKDRYYRPYIFYNIPKSLVESESQIAKEWADTIRTDIPKLAKWFEKAR